MQNNNTIKIFLDTEFTGLHQQSSLISLAMVAETGEEFYAEITDYDHSQISDWVEDNVMKYLFLNETDISDARSYKVKGPQQEVAAAIQKWLEQFPKTLDADGKVQPSIQVWADCYAWDWVLFCELFGGAFEIPPAIHYMTMDLATLFNIKTGKPDTPRFDFVKDEIAAHNWQQHNALYDARVEKLCYEKLMRE